MNKIFKVIWDISTGTYKVAGEMAKSRGKKTGSRKLALLAAVGLSSLLSTGTAFANAGDDTGAGVVVDQAGTGWIAIGTGVTANTFTSVDGASAALGYYASAMGRYSTSIGSYSQSGGDASLALGVKANSSGNRSIAMGASSTASGGYAMAMGVQSNASGANSVSLGYLAKASGDDSVALGKSASATGINSVAIGANSTALEDDTVAVGNATTQRKITFVGSGAINSTSTDAVNGAQVYAVSQSVATRLGGGATVNANGTVNAPSYSVGTGTYNNVGSALQALDTSITDLSTTITTLDTDTLQWDNTASSYSASHGASTTNKITNVAAGTLSDTSTDAVNGAQLFATNQLIAQTSDTLIKLAGDTSTTYITNNGSGVNYVRTNDTGLTADDAHASGVGATAVGYNAVASGVSSLAMGQNSNSVVDTGIALGSGSTSDRTVSGSKQETQINADGTITIGHDTTDQTLLGALSLGTEGESYRQITNVADGTQAQDAVTIRQLQNAIGAVSTSSTQYFHANSTLEDSLAVGTDSIAVGPKTVVNADAGIGIGSGAIVDQTATNSIAIGTNAQASFADSIALGSNSTTSVGAQSSYTAYNLSGAQKSVGEFSVGSATGQRQITNVAAGSADTDAVNVAQLKVTDSNVAENTANITSLTNQYSTLNTRVTTLETSMGDITVSGGSDYLAVNSTGEAAIATGEESVAVGASSTASAKNSVALGSGSVANEENTVSVGSSSQQRRITNVSAGVNSTDAVNVAQLNASEAGSIRYETNADGSANYSVLNLGDGNGSTTQISNVSAAVNDTDAVNYAQLKQSVESANTYTDQKMGEMNSKIRGVEDKMSGGIASAMAMAGLPQAYAPGASMTSIAGSTYNGETAVALGVSMVSASGSWVYKLQGTSNSQGDYSAAIGAGIQW